MMATPVDSPTVNALLRVSMAEHMAYRAAVDRRGKKAALQNALEHRVNAHELDPEHASSGWQDEQTKTPTGLDTHDELMRFYVEQMRRRA